jgi:hypothetical protein
VLIKPVRRSVSGKPTPAALRRGGGGSSFGSSNQSLVGLGIIAGKKPFFTGVFYYLYTLIVVRIYDGETFAQLTRKHRSTT